MTQGATTTESYSYDAVGNRLSSLGMSPYVYNSSNEMTSTPAATFTFDGNGNTLTKVDSNGTTTYGWDFENRLTSVALPGTGGTVTFKYDPFGRRIQKNSTGGDNNYVYDGPNVIEAVDGGGSVAVRYAQGVGVGEPVAVIRQGSLSYYEADGLGSITSLTDSSSTIASSYIYDSFGKLTASAGTVLDTFRYTGQELDTETGLYYYRARYYDPAVGRFLTEDPIEFDNSGSLYTYVENAPLDFVDPYGLQSAKPLPSGGNADNWTYGEIGQFGVNSMGDFSSPSGLADAKASIAAACQRQGNRCNAGRPAPRRPADIAAWNNIVNASGGTDLSGGGNFMCVNTQNCWFVHRCYACKNNRKTIIERATPLQPSGTVSVGHPPNQGTIYFYSDPLQGWDNAADRASACRPRPHPRPHRRRRK